jgi:SRSO17 transposase
MGLMHDDGRANTPPPSGTPPVLTLTPQDVTNLVSELAAYQEEFAPLFRRAEQRHWARAYLHGQLLELERKSIEPMALAQPEGNVQALQQFISVGAWDAAPILAKHQQLVAATLGDAATGMLIIDGCDFPKQGSHSVGVARQRCGPLGKVANCQSSVVACYVSQHGYTLVDRRLFLPEKWFTDAYGARRAACGVPANLTFQTHHALAADVIRALHASGVLPFTWVTFDEEYGRATILLDTVADLGLLYLAEVPRNTRVYRVGPDQAVQVGPPQRVDDLIAGLTASDWQRDIIKEGAKGPLAADFAFLRVRAIRDEKPGPAVWLVVRRSLGPTPDVKAYLSNAPADTPTSAFVWRSAMRWPIETAIEECKGVLGMDHYEVRSWVGWHHHITLTFLAHHFLVRLQRRLTEKGGGLKRAVGPLPSDRRPAQAHVRHLNHPSFHPTHPGPKLRGLSRPPPAHFAAAR